MIRTIYFLLLLLTLVACTQPTTPDPTTTPTIAPTAQPTTAPTLIPTLEPTPTPTYSQQANQLLLADGRFTRLLDEMTQEIGRGLSDAEQEQVLALARALWLPDHLDESDWLPDPAGVTLHWRPNLDGREGPVLLVAEAQPDSPYAAGAVIFWHEERLLSLTPGRPGYYFEFGRVQQNNWDFETWIKYDAGGNLYSFVHPETGQYVTPQGDGTFFILSDLGADGRPTNGEFYWVNDGEPVGIAAAPDGSSLMDYIQTTNRSIESMLIDGQEYLVIIDAAGINTEYRFNTITGQWESFEFSAVDTYHEAMKLIDSAQVILPNEVSEPTRLQIAVSPKLVDGYGGLIYAVLLDGNLLNDGISRIISDNMSNNNDKFTLPIYDPDTRTVTPTEINPNTDFKLTVVHYEDGITLPHGYGVGDPVEFGVFLRDGYIELVQRFVKD